MVCVYDSKMQAKTSAGHGGFRPGAGGKPAGYVRPPEVIDLDREKARNERAKANINEFEYAVLRGRYVDRAEVRQAAATALAELAQTLRSVPDSIERRLGVSPEVAAEVGDLIDHALNEVAARFEAVAEQALADEADDADAQPQEAADE